MVSFGQLGGRDLEVPGGGVGGGPNLHQDDDAEFLQASSSWSATGFQQS